MVKDEKTFPFNRVVSFVEVKGAYTHRKFVHFSINCLMCDKKMVVSKCRLNQKFCSRKCKNDSLSSEYRGHTHPWFAPEGDKACENCGESFHTKPSRLESGRGRFCSRECYIVKHPMKVKFPRVTRVCLFCCNKFVTTNAKAAPTHCSVSCSILDSYESGRSIPQRGKLNGRFGKPPKFMEYDIFVDRLGREFRLRSSYEIAFVEQYLDKNEMSWEYESKTFDLGSCSYTPDFWVDELEAFIEIKGFMRDDARKKIELFKKLNSDVRLLVAMRDSLRYMFEVDVSNRAVDDIHKRYNSRTFVRSCDRKKAA